MNRNRIRICGRNTRTLPAPAITPSTTRLRSRPSGMWLATSCPVPSISDLIWSIGHWAQLNTAWNIRNSTAVRIAMPQTGCSSTRSSASSTCVLATGSVSAASSRRCTSWWSRITASIAAWPTWPCGGSASRCTPGPDAGAAAGSCDLTSHSSIVASSASAPPERTATVSTTGTPSSCSRRARSIRMPRLRATSARFSATSIGLPRRRASITMRSVRRRLVASVTHTSRSGGASPARLPLTTSRVTVSSALVAFRL